MSRKKRSRAGGLQAKRRFGEPNPIIQQEEKEFLATLDRARYSSPNSQVLGRNGELPVLQFLERYLPYMLKARTGHFLTPAGKVSRQIDILILDGRYPLLSENLDGSVLAPLHAVLATIEVKTNLTPTDIRAAWGIAAETAELAAEAADYDNPKHAAYLAPYVLAYRSRHRARTLEDCFLQAGAPGYVDLEVYLLRLPNRDQPEGQEIGATLYFQEVDGYDETVYEMGWFLFHTPLSDLYYSLVHRAFAALHARAWTYGDIAEQLRRYMTWTSFAPLAPRDTRLIEATALETVRKRRSRARRAKS